MAPFLTTKSATAGTWELAARCCGKQEGAVVAYKPHPWTWGRIERKHFRFVIVQDLSEEQVSVLASSGKCNGKEFDRRFTVKFQEMKKHFPQISVSDEKLKNPRENYQPFKTDECKVDLKKHFVIIDLCTDKPVDVEDLKKEPEMPDGG